MDVLDSYGFAIGLTIGVLSAAFSFLNRQRYKTLITDIYQPGNDELRNQLATAREDKTSCEKAVTEWKTKYEQQNKYIDKLEKLNLRLPDFARLTELISNNHTQTMSQLTDLTSKIVEQGHDTDRS